MKMKYLVFAGLAFFLFQACSLRKTADNGLEQRLSDQLNVLVQATDDSEKLPRSWTEEDGYKMIGIRDWCSGFPAGMYWYMYDLNNDAQWKNTAIRATEKLDGVQYYTGTHDLGFMVFCSYGNAYRLTGDEAYKEVILQGAKSLASRFNPVTGTIRSWDWGKWQFPVIIDNMMNLEMLFWASKVSGDSRFRDMAVTHANTTLENHFREDMSSYHVVSYDTITGQVERKQTHQGYSDDSAWARGQSWGLYGYVVCYRETGDPKYLKAAEDIAAFIIPNLPDDLIPYWDYNDPKIPNSERDASAAALVASAFYELGTMVADGQHYFDLADQIVEKLSSPAYLAEGGANGGFLLKHCVGHLPGNSEINVPLNYADYYYLEAIKRKHELKK
ncbi:glycoside hydrolase family 88 protein [Sunxiuqinia sp. sy24]|uniref:glycoside hydrolase family 88 protein n=1 Tax=Sunxiuqinia sp. sy24 TaxID=3461495 RepID=UPI004045E70C